MRAEEKSDGLGGSSSLLSSSQRQRFYVDLVPGQTTIVSWRKLLRKPREKDPSWPPAAAAATANAFVMRSLNWTHSFSSAHEIPRRTVVHGLDGISEVVQRSDMFVRSGKLENKNRGASSGNKQQPKRRVEMKTVKGARSNDFSSTKRRRLEKMSYEATAASPVKDHYLNGLQAFAIDAPVLLHRKKYAGNDSISESPPLNSVMDASLLSLKTKANDLQKIGKICFEKARMKVGTSGDSSDAVHWNSAGKCIPLKNNPRFRKLMDKKKIEVFSKSQLNDKRFQSRELADVVSPAYKFSSPSILNPKRDFKKWQLHSVSTKYVAPAGNDAADVRIFSRVLEKAIRELEKTVAESKSFKVEASDAHTSWLAIERELPLEVQRKLGKVASIMKSRREMPSEDLVTCLVNIIRRLVRGKTSKRILRKVILVKLSARMEKAEKFKEIKDDILAMVDNHPPNLQAANNLGTKGEKIFAETCNLNTSMEDKLCDLYDLCVQGFEGDKGAQVQKLFIELSELWPKGVMNYNKLRDAINRAKSRRRVLLDKNQRQKAAGNGRMVADDVNRNTNPLPGTNRTVTYSSPSLELIASPTGRPVAWKTDRVKKDLSMKRNLTNAAAIPHMNEHKQQVAEKANMKIRFSLKPQHGTLKPEEQAVDNKSSCLTTAARLSCNRQS